MEDIRAIEDKTKEELDQVSRPGGYLIRQKIKMLQHFSTLTVLCFTYGVRKRVSFVLVGSYS
jgi:hypothetical protein